MPPNRKPKQKLREITYKNTQNLSRSEQLPEPRTPIVIEVDHSRKRMSLNSSQTDSSVLVWDGAPPSPDSPDFIPSTDGPASYSSYSRRVNRELQAKEARDASKSRERESSKAREANSRRDVEKRLAESAAEANRRKKAADSKNAARLAYLELVKRNTMNVKPRRLNTSDWKKHSCFQILTISRFNPPVHSDLDNESFTSSSRPIRKGKADQIYMSNVAKPSSSSTKSLAISLRSFFNIVRDLK
jgi:hypothetical protein